MLIDIGSDPRRIHRQILEFLRKPLLPGLKDKELDVLSQLMFYHNKYKHYPEEDRVRLIMHKDNKREMREYLGITKPTFDNYVSDLRRKNVLLGDRINARYIIEIPEGSSEFHLSFRFNMKDNTQGTQNNSTDERTHIQDHDAEEGSRGGGEDAEPWTGHPAGEQHGSSIL